MNAVRLKRDLILGVATMSLLLGMICVMAAPVEAKNPYAKPNNSWISISGTVQDVSADSFTLDYGKGVVTVEMDDGDRDADGYLLLEGDEVTVNGRIDDDLFETTKIEAGSVFVEKLGTTFYASSLDEEDYWVTVTTPVVLSGVVVRGTVTSVSDQEFTINTGLSSLNVEVDEMFYNPVDDEGYQRIEKGDFVSVTGTMDENLFGMRELKAETIVELID